MAARRLAPRKTPWGALSLRPPARPEGLSSLPVMLGVQAAMNQLISLAALPPPQMVNSPPCGGGGTPAEAGRQARPTRLERPGCGLNLPRLRGPHPRARVPQWAGLCRSPHSHPGSPARWVWESEAPGARPRRRQRGQTRCARTREEGHLPAPKCHLSPIRGREIQAGSPRGRGPNACAPTPCAGPPRGRSLAGFSHVGGAGRGQYWVNSWSLRLSRGKRR